MQFSQMNALIRFGLVQYAMFKIYDNDSCLGASGNLLSWPFFCLIENSNYLPLNNKLSFKSNKISASVFTVIKARTV